MEIHTDRKVKRLRIDNGLELCNKKFDDFCVDYGIVRHKLTPYIVKHKTVRHTQQQNGLLRG